MRSRSIAPLAAAVLLASVTLAGCSGDDGVGEVPVTPTRTASDGVSPTAGATASPAPRSADAPALDVEVVAKGFEHGWDIGFLPDGRALVTERPGRISIVSGLREGARRTTVKADFDDLFVSGEGGLMGMVVHPDFATSRLFTTCQTHQEDGQPKDVRLVTWKLSADGTSAEKVRDLLTGLPISTGRHSGCRPTIAPVP
jgi:glucose/arabinose dehydrogenase